MADLNARDTKLVQYLNEALTKEKQLETALEAHIGMTTLTPYRKRLRQHLNETKRHGREVQRRIKQLMHAEVVSPGLNRLVRSPEVLDIVEGILGPDISLFHCKLLMKAARGGTVTPWHQDYSYWVTEDNRPLMLNCMLQIDDATVENGCSTRARIMPSMKPRPSCRETEAGFATSAR